MAQVSRVYRDPLYADELAGKAPERARIHRQHGFARGATSRQPDPRGVLGAINEYELMRACGGWWQMTGEHPDVAVLARLQLVMAGIAEAERRLQEVAEGSPSGGASGGGGRGRWSGGSDSEPPPGGHTTRRETLSVARSAYTKKRPVFQAPDPLAGTG